VASLVPARKSLKTSAYHRRPVVPARLTGMLVHGNLDTCHDV